MCAFWCTISLEVNKMVNQATQHKSARISTRIDENLKQKAESILDDLGLSPSEAIIMYYKQILLRRGIPFDVRLPDDTLEAIEDLETGKNISKYKTLDEMYKDLHIPC